MKSSPSSPSSPSPADASQCTAVPRPSSSLPSSFTPFYPRSKPYYCYSGSGIYYYAEPPAKYDSNASNSYSQDSQDFGGQSGYTSLDEYEHTWMSEYPCSRGFMDSNGVWRHWNDSNYVDDSSFIASGSLSLNLPPNLLPQNVNISPVGKSTYFIPQNRTSSLHNLAVTVPSSSAVESSTLPARSSSSNKKINISNIKFESKANTFENQARSIGKRIEAPKVFYPEKLDTKSISPKSSQILSVAGAANDKRTNEQLTEIKASYSSHDHDEDISNNNIKDPLDDNIHIKGTVSIPANLESGCTSFKDAGCSSLSTCSGVSHADIGGTNSVSKDKIQNENIFSISSHGNDSQKIQSTEGGIHQSSKGTSTKNASDGFTDIGSSHERKSCAYDVKDVENMDESQLLVKSIYHLSMLLSRSKSSTAHKSFDKKDLAIVKSIYMLSLSLTQDSVMGEAHPEDVSFMEQQINEKSTDVVVNTGTKQDVGMSNILECLGPLVNVLNRTASFENSSCRRAEGVEVCKHISTVEKCRVQEENASIEDRLLQLKDDFLKLQDEISYERTESNATVSIYKNLWSEAHDNLAAFKLEMLKIKDNLKNMNDMFQKLKNAGHITDISDRNIKSCHIDQNEYTSYKKSEDVAAEHNSENPEISGQKHDNQLEENCAPIVRLKEDCKSVQKGNGLGPQILVTPLSMLEMNDTIKHSMNLENEVSQRLSVLLARPKIEIEMRCINDDSIPDSFNLHECSKDVFQGDHSEVSHVGYNAAYEESSLSSETPCLSDTSMKHLIKCDANLPEYLMKCDTNLPTMVNDCSWDHGEDETEIICLRPSYADYRLGLAKGETEWEHVEIERNT